jgi:hypothetical protein
MRNTSLYCKSVQKLSPDLFEAHGRWQKRQTRVEWLAARQAAKAAVRATRADRDARKPLPRALPPPPRPRCHIAHHSASAEDDGGDPHA